MRTSIKLGLMALAASLMLAAVVSTATANRISVSNRNIRSVFRELTLSAEGGGTEIICPVTLEGTFHSNTIVKTVGSLIGYVTRAIVQTDRCNGFGKARVNNASLPWHLKYEGFLEVLPNPILRITLVNAEFTVEPILGANCVYRGNARGRISRTATNTILTADETLGIARIAGTVCPNPGFFSGTAPVTLLGTNTLILTSLI